MMQKESDTREHWNAIYQKNDIDELGWYESTPRPSLKLIEKCQLAAGDPIIDIGAGTTTLVDALFNRGYTDLSVVDISRRALDHLKSRLPQAAQTGIRFIEEDVTDPVQLLDHDPVKLWHDRALLHFLRDPDSRQAYKNLLDKLVVPGGYVIIAVFSEKGVEKCSGLRVKRYSRAELQSFLGSDYRLQESFDYLYTTPSGAERPYIYTLFRRTDPTNLQGPNQ